MDFTRTLGRDEKEGIANYSNQIGTIQSRRFITAPLNFRHTCDLDAVEASFLSVLQVLSVDETETLHRLLSAFSNIEEPFRGPDRLNPGVGRYACRLYPDSNLELILMCDPSQISPECVIASVQVKCTPLSGVPVWHVLWSSPMCCCFEAEN